MSFHIPLLIISFCFLFPQSLIASQPDTTRQNQTDLINFFLDCRGCNDRYIRNSINFVTFVRDQSDADVHLLITLRYTGSGGREYTLRFLGKKSFSNQNDTLKYVSYQSDTEDIRRRGLVKKIKAGLLPYLYQTEIINDLSIIYDRPQRQEVSADRWDKWVFEIGANSYFNGEETRRTANIRGWASARRITQDWKTEFNFSKRFNQRSFTNDDTTETFITQRNQFNSLIAKSINDHWSLGLFTEASTSTRNNYDLRIGGAPGIEFNIFPYAEYSEHEISFRYNIVTTYNNYDQVTIFNKREELLFQNRLSADLNFTQPWGEIEVDIDAFAYMHDWSKNRLVFDLELDLQVTRGVSLNLSGRYSLINDQLAIPRREISEEEQLLNLREQATSYFYGISFGFEYTFGSIYSTVVNPRF